MKYKILLIEDDFELVGVIRKNLESWNYTVKAVDDFQNIISEFVDFEPHLVLMDIMLPFYNGYHWCTQIRKLSNLPIVFLSSASENMNIVMAMNMGADDFISKPVDLLVLNAKLQAVLRRAYDLVNHLHFIEHRGVILNLNDGTVVAGKESMELTKNEFRILQTLLEQKGNIVSREQLMTRLWQNDCYVEENTLTVNVNRLRKKLEGIGVRDYIGTKIGSGYIIE